MFLRGIAEEDAVAVTDREFAASLVVPCADLHLAVCLRLMLNV
jgi:hypothetical protein